MSESCLFNRLTRGRCRKAWLLFASIALLCNSCRERERFLVSVERHFSTAEEEAFILTAEGICPAREDVLAVADPEDVDALNAEAGGNCLWWYICCFKVPYAITTDAIAYFEKRVNTIRQESSPLAIVYPTASLKYEAAIEYKDVFTYDGEQYSDIYVIHMRLYYGEVFGFLSGAFFEKERIVVVTLEGEALAVLGDGPTSVAII